MEPDRELKLRKLACNVARAIVALSCIAFLVAAFVSVAEYPFERTVLIAFFAVAATMSLIVFIAWATGSKNKQRIKELEKQAEKR